jgi:hypothetical protein
MGEKNQLINYLKTIMSNIDREIGDIPLLSMINKKANIKPSYIFVGITIIILASVILEMGSHIITTIFGLAYPSYMSFKVMIM